MFPTAKVSGAASVADVPGSSSAIFAQDLFSAGFMPCSQNPLMYHFGTLEHRYNPHA